MTNLSITIVSQDELVLTDAWRFAGEMMTNARSLDWHWTHCGRDTMDAILQTTLSDAFYWMKTFDFFYRISLKYVPKCHTNNHLALVKIMRWNKEAIRAPADSSHKGPLMQKVCPCHDNMQRRIFWCSFRHWRYLKLSSCQISLLSLEH